MKVGKLKLVRIQKAERADACSRKVQEHRGSQPTRSHNEHSGTTQAALAFVF